MFPQWLLKQYIIGGEIDYLCGGFKIMKLYLIQKYLSKLGKGKLNLSLRIQLFSSFMLLSNYMVQQKNEKKIGTTVEYPGISSEL